MKNTIKVSFYFLILMFIAFSCDTISNDTNKAQIVYKVINKEFVLIRDVQTLQTSNDEISKHVDSIISGLINEEFVSTGQKIFDLDFDLVPDIGFEIIDLNKFNSNDIPESFDTLAARVIPLSCEILDNSTYGYPDALNLNENISQNGNWTNSTSVLGTFLTAGQFKGKGEKYLGFRIPIENEYKYGWINIYCSQNNDTLRIIDFAYNDLAESQIYAGQIE